jgi:DNA-binding transcriptional MocR family regulator
VGEYLRLSISTVDEGEIVEGVRRLTLAFREAHGQRRS